MKPHITGAVSLVLVLTTFSSLVSMISILRIDQMVHGDLYAYGLRFSYQWAVPYWTMTTIVFGLGWFNIITAMAFQFYVLIYGRREALIPELSEEPQPQPTKEEIIEMIEKKPAEKVEESKEQAVEQVAAKPAEEPAEKAEKEPEETQTVAEDTSQREQSEKIQTEEVEEQKEQESKPAEESKTETKETSTPATETEQETREKSEETPTPVEVSEEPASQAGTSPL